MAKKTTDGPVPLSSTVLPTADDVSRWQRMSDAQRRAYLEAELEDARQSGASDKSMDDLWTEARRIAATARENAV